MYATFDDPPNFVYEALLHDMHGKEEPLLLGDACNGLNKKEQPKFRKYKMMRDFKIQYFEGNSLTCVSDKNV